LAVWLQAAGAGCVTVMPGEANAAIRTVRTIRDVDPAAWDRLADANPLLSHGWLRTAEDEWFEDVERVYFLLESDGRLVGAAACYVDGACAGAESVDDLLFGRLRSSALGRVLSLQPALVCGFPWSLGPGCVTEAGASETRRGERVGLLVDAITRESLRRKCSAVFLSVTDNGDALARSLRANGYDGVRHEPIYTLDLEWPSFDAYCRGLPGRNIRKNIRWELNKNRKQGVVIREIAAPFACEARLHEIVDRHYRRYGWPAFPYRQGWFQSMKENLGSAAVIATASRADIIVAVTVSLRKQHTRHMILACVDHGAAGNDLTHFNLAYYWPVDECIRRGDRRYVVGPGQHTSRTRRGYRPLNSYIYCRSPGAARRLVNRLWFRVLSAWLRKKVG
jgi:predicted N-acyltransferase